MGKKRVVVITGGSGIIGKAIAKTFAAKGDTVVLLDRNEEAALKASEEVNSSYPQHCFYEIGDVLIKTKLEENAQNIIRRFGGFDVLVNCAGGNHPDATTTDEIFGEQVAYTDNVKTFFDLTETGIDAVMDLNFKGTLLPCQVFGKYMAEKEKGNIINISSMNAFTPLTKIPAYSAAKSAVSNFTQWLAVYFAKSGIRVNAVAPGFLATAQNKTLLFDENNQPTKRTEKILSQTPMHRFGEPNEISEMIYVLSDESVSSFITGVLIPIDGGFSSFSGV